MNDGLNRNDSSHVFSAEDADRILNAAEDAPSKNEQTDKAASEGASGAASSENTSAGGASDKESFLKNREARRAKIREMKKRRLLAYILLTAIIILIIIGIVLVVRAVRRSGKPADFSQIGPMPTESITVETIKNPYDYTQEVPESEKQSSDWFSDALIIGESRIQGFELYGYAEGAQLFYSSSMTTENAMSGTGYDRSGNEVTLSQLLSENTYGKIYIALGLNEMGWYYPDDFEDSLASLIEMIKSAQPDAQIYLQTLIPVTSSLASSHAYITIDKILAADEMIKNDAVRESVFLLGLPSELVTDNALNEEYAEANGLSLTSSGFAVWEDYLLTHTVNRSDYTW
ncbi:MAG: hypothetical protein ACOX6J_02600 [Oscillospiraceae bacterium]